MHKHWEDLDRHPTTQKSLVLFCSRLNKISPKSRAMFDYSMERSLRYTTKWTSHVFVQTARWRETRRPWLHGSYRVSGMVRAKYSWKCIVSGLSFLFRWLCLSRRRNNKQTECQDLSNEKPTSVKRSRLGRRKSICVAHNVFVLNKWTLLLWQLHSHRRES